MSMYFSSVALIDYSFAIYLLGLFGSQIFMVDLSHYSFDFDYLVSISGIVGSCFFGGVALFFFGFVFYLKK